LLSLLASYIVKDVRIRNEASPESVKHIVVKLFIQEVSKGLVSKVKYALVKPFGG
jgi:hypothetical protein